MLNNISVRFRLLVLALLPVLFLGVSNQFSTHVMGGLDQGISALYADRIKPLQQIKVVSDHYAVSIVDLMHKYRAGVVNQRQVTELIEQAESSAKKEWAAYLGTSLTEEEKRLVRNVEATMAPVVTLVNRYKKTIGTGEVKQQPANEFVKELYDHFDPLSGALTELIELQLRESAHFRDQSHDQFVVTQSRLQMSVGSVLVLLLLTAWFIYRSIQTPLNNLQVTISTVAANADLTVRAAELGNDEFSATARSFNLMLDRLQGLIQTVSEAVVVLTGSADQMLSVSTQVASAATEQEQQSAMVATAVTEMSAAIQEVAHNALNTSQKAQSADQQAQLGQDKVRQNIAAIGELSRAVDETSNAIEQLHGQANDINQVVQVIKDVAEQTNLLALNAAIEAARAGESGRGFAVVADEVRTLAHNTRQATESINDMIAKLQIASKHAVDTMKDAKSKAVLSTDRAGESSEALKTITESISLISDMNIQVSTATEEQTAVANEISRNINEFSASIIYIAEQAERSSATSKELTDLSSLLQKKISAFVL